ncbi:EamA family transporter [Georgenia sp. M64]|uniref:EamA family transporter n=1 Tax=Georgenia sp. M64 TaxID=3120520 RepID=UPI0030E401E4
MGPGNGRSRGTGAATGVWLALVSAAAFGTSGSLAKSLLEAGWSPAAAVTARIGVAALVLTPAALVSLRGRWHLLRGNARLVTTYGLVAVAGCQLMYFNAVATLSVGVALLLEYLGPVLVVVWLWLRHGRRPRRWTLAGIALAVAGLVLVLDVAAGVRVDLGGALWALGAAVGLAAFFVLSADDSTGLPPLVMATGGLVVATLTLVVAGLVGAVPVEYSTADVVLAHREVPWFVPVALLSVVAAALAYAAGIGAARRLGSKVASFVGLTEVVFAVLIAWLVLGELPVPVQLAGGVLIVAGVLAVRYDEAAPALASSAKRSHERAAPSPAGPTPPSGAAGGHDPVPTARG